MPSGADEKRRVVELVRHAASCSPPFDLVAAEQDRHPRLPGERAHLLRRRRDPHRNRTASTIPATSPVRRRRRSPAASSAGSPGKSPRHGPDSTCRPDRCFPESGPRAPVRPRASTRPATRGSCPTRRRSAIRTTATDPPAAARSAPAGSRPRCAAAALDAGDERRHAVDAEEAGELRHRQHCPPGCTRAAPRESRRSGCTSARARSRPTPAAPPSARGRRTPSAARRITTANKAGNRARYATSNALTRTATQVCRSP